MNIILASTSTLFEGNYLEYLKEEIQKLYDGIDNVLFIPYARPSGISYDEYTEIAKQFFKTIKIDIKGIHECKIQRKRYKMPKHISWVEEIHFFW